MIRLLAVVRVRGGKAVVGGVVWCGIVTSGLDWVRYSILSRSATRIYHVCK